MYNYEQGPQNVFKFALLSTLNPFIDILGVIHIYPKDLKLVWLQHYLLIDINNVI